MLIPPYLKIGDTIGLVSPAGKVQAKSVLKAQSYLKDMGFKVLVGKYALDSWHQFAGTDDVRAADFNELLVHPQVKAIWCVRGGYGAIRLLGKINFEVLKASPKWLIGFSDITVFHSLLQTELKLISIHADMPTNIDKKGALSGFDALFDMLLNGGKEVVVPFHPLNKLGKAGGQLIGGNLTLLHSLVGTPLDFNPSGKILFIEEVGEHLYHLDRMLRAMKLAEKLAQLSGLIVGQISDVKDTPAEFGASAYEIIAQVLEEYDFPVLFNFPAGHAQPNMPIMLGADVQLQVEQGGSTIRYV